MAEFLNSLATDELFAFFLIFVRMGTALMFFPGFSEVYVLDRSRLALALVISLVLTPVLQPIMPAYSPSPALITLLITGEILVGAFFGLVARVLFMALETGGTIISFQASLGNATIFNPLMASQGSLISVFLIITGALLIFVTDLHHLMLAGLVESYEVFKPGFAPPLESMSEYFAKTMAKSFFIAVQISAPLLIIGVLFYLGLGLLGRLMPQVQVFFIIMPLQILLGFLVLVLSLTSIFYWFLTNFENELENFLG